MSLSPRILVSNDDGIDAAGIRALAKAMKEIGDVVVVAPDTQQSAVGHALTVSLPLRATRHSSPEDLRGWSVSGTPADCVKLAVKRLLDQPPDLVVSGINHGRNTAVSLVYSGTVSGATEGTLLGIPSIAFSLDDFSHNADFTYAARVASWFAPQVIARGLPRGVLLNVNIPALPESEILGLRLARQGDSYWDDNYDERRDPMGRPYYWLSGHNVLLGPEGSDEELLTAGYVTITPIHYRLTDESSLNNMAAWGLEIDGPIPSATSIRSAAEDQ